MRRLLARHLCDVRRFFAGPRAAGRWVGIQNSLGNLSGAISPWVTGVIIDRTGHYTLAFIAAAMVSALGIVGWIGLVPNLVPLKWKWRDVPAHAPAEV